MAFHLEFCHKIEPLCATFKCRRLWIDKSQDLYRVKKKRKSECSNAIFITFLLLCETLPFDEDLKNAFCRQRDYYSWSLNSKICIDFIFKLRIKVFEATHVWFFFSSGSESSFYNYLHLTEFSFCKKTCTFWRGRILCKGLLGFLK